MYILVLNKTCPQYVAPNFSTNYLEMRTELAAYMKKIGPTIRCVLSERTLGDFYKREYSIHFRNLKKGPIPASCLYICSETSGSR